MDILETLKAILAAVTVPKKDRQYIVDIQFYAGSQINTIPVGCNAILFINTGTANVVINGVLVITAGEFFAIDGNQDEVDMTLYRFFFQGAGTQGLTVLRKILN
jgi:hypothetical protein